MSNQTVQVTAEWALWGKEPHDVEYRLLRCSNGPFQAGNFEELITRYSPGTLDSLPQVAIAWGGNEEHRYLAMTIHRAPRQGLYDASGRKVVLTRCFCVPFHELAAGPVSYQAMYQAFRQERLSATGEAGIKVDLPVMSPPDPDRRMPMLVANLLLTDIPVCILGADRVDLDTRLAFLDSVMALLPYGMRAELSASTWTNSIFEEHKFRLFFTSARREAEEHVLTWDPDRVVSIRHDSHDYMHWLSTDIQAKMDLLATQISPSGFKALDVIQMMGRLQEAWERTKRYDADEPYPSPYAIDKPQYADTRLPPSQPLPSGALPAEPTADGREGPRGWRQRRKEKARRRKERKGVRAGDAKAPSAFRTGVAARSEAKVNVAREAPAVVSVRDRYDRWAHAVTRLAVIWGIGISVVAALVLVLMTVK